MGGGSGGHDEAKTFTAGAAPATAQVDRCPDSGPPSLPDLSPSVSEILPTLERELLMRYIDLPFNRLTPNVTGFSAEEAMSDSGNGSARPMPPSIVSRGSSIDSTSGSGTAGSTLPAFHGVDDDDDEGESGVLSNNDFRNMSLKVSSGFLAIRVSCATLPATSSCPSWRVIPLSRYPVIPLCLRRCRGQDHADLRAIPGATVVVSFVPYWVTPLPKRYRQLGPLLRHSLRNFNGMLVGSGVGRSMRRKRS